MLVEINNDNPIWRERPKEKNFWIALNSDESEPENYPVDVINVNGAVIGTANDKDEYIEVWNADPDNMIRGSILGNSRPFVYLLIEDPFTSAIGLMLENGEGFLLENNDILILE